MRLHSLKHSKHDGSADSAQKFSKIQVPMGGLSGFLGGSCPPPPSTPGRAIPARTKHPAMSYVYIKVLYKMIIIVVIIRNTDYLEWVAHNNYLQREKFFTTGLTVKFKVKL